MAAFNRLREDESWIEATEVLTPKEWVIETNKRLQGRDVESLQLLLLALPLKSFKRIFGCHEYAPNGISTFSNHVFLHMYGLSLVFALAFNLSKLSPILFPQSVT